MQKRRLHYRRFKRNVDFEMLLPDTEVGKVLQEIEISFKRGIINYSHCRLHSTVEFRNYALGIYYDKDLFRGGGGIIHGKGGKGLYTKRKLS